MPVRSWGGLAQALLIGGLLVSFPFLPFTWLLRLWALGWMAEAIGSRAAGRDEPYPSWRHPIRHFRRGLGLFVQLFFVLLPPSFLFYSGWLAGWVISFERVRDYRAFGPLSNVAGILLLACCFVLLPLATARAAAFPGHRAGLELAPIWALVRALPGRYFVVLGVTMVATTPLQLLRQPRLQSMPEFVMAGLGTFAILFAIKSLWAGHYRLSQEAMSEGRQAGSVWAGIALVPSVLLGILYGIRLIATQFFLWNSHAEWFAHVTFLLPGAPASLGTDRLLW